VRGGIAPAVRSGAVSRARRLHGVGRDDNPDGTARPRFRAATARVMGTALALHVSIGANGKQLERRGSVPASADEPGPLP